MKTAWKVRQAIGLLVLCVAGLAQASPRVGEPSPVDLLGKTPEGEEVRISAHLGKAMVVSFWASWCGYCRKQFPLLDHLQSEVGTDRLRVVVVNFKEPAADYRSIRRALRKSPVTWTHDRDGALSDAFGVTGVPRMYIFDKAGTLVAIRSGYSEEGAVRTIEILNEVLARPAPAADPAPAAEVVATASGLQT
ncbi:TlpA family protein disulfide reductase [Luteimonas saliphila]|uniref:TlpA family protein disulfide reductase n=1 Tax=Luteimonas saliphila TaxID=2804919 RepID=UPI00192D7277|nr:TlpA disulfide reductase family protein [Luteimonas saliphila]